MISSLVSTDSQEGLRQFGIDYVLPGFEETMREQGEFVTPAEMPHCLATHIQSVIGARDQNPQCDLVREGLRDPDAVGYVATSTEMTSDLVSLDLPTRHWDDMNDPNVYVALDEGCNTTCHSEHRGHIAEAKLKSLGPSPSWKSQESKTVTLDSVPVQPRLDAGLYHLQ